MKLFPVINDFLVTQITWGHLRKDSQLSHTKKHLYFALVLSNLFTFALFVLQIYSIFPNASSEISFSIAVSWIFTANLFGVILGQDIRSGSFQVNVLSRVSKILPGGHSRSDEISRRLNRSRRIAHRADLKSELSNIQKEQRKEIIEDFKKDPKLFVEKHFYPSQSLVRHYLEKALIDGEPNVAFIYNTLLIPKRKELPVESLKNLFYGYAHASSRALVQKEYYLDNSHVSKLFKKYSYPQITTMFSRPYSFSLYAELLEKASEPLDVASTLGQVFDNVMMVGQVVNPSLLEIDKKTIEGLTFNLLRTRRQYISCGNAFGNCIRSSFEKENDSDYVAVYQGEMPLLCVRLGQKFSIMEIKGVRNTAVQPDLIKKVKQAFEK